MSAKLAKSLRKLAKKMSAEAGITAEVATTENKHNRPVTYVRDRDGEIMFDEKGNALTREVGMGSVSVDTDTVRGVYLRLKKAASKVKKQK